jgi:hypothetical protein
MKLGRTSDERDKYIKYKILSGAAHRAEVTMPQVPFICGKENYIVNTDI